jgi:hypothetical protein
LDIGLNGLFVWGFQGFKKGIRMNMNFGIFRDQNWLGTLFSLPLNLACLLLKFYRRKRLILGNSFFFGWIFSKGKRFSQISGRKLFFEGRESSPFFLGQFERQMILGGGRSSIDLWIGPKTLGPMFPPSFPEFR